MAKNNVNIKIEANTKQAAQGIDKLTEKVNKFAKESNSKLSKFSKVGSAVSGVAAAFSMATGAVKAAAAAVNETVEAYNKQAAAEIQLESAAKNNPYLNAASVQSLKEYAGELQSISTFGDEELIPMMAQLAAAGRTQAEIQDIMSASVDIAASGAMSLESAVKNLSKTYSGLSGELGEANPKIKALTTEQLKNGEAVKVMKAQYSGMAQNVADATGGWKQFQNTLGDLKEVIGKDFAESKNSAGKILNGFLSNVVSGLSSANKEAEAFKKKIKAIADAEGGDASGAKDAKSILEQENKEYEEGIKALTMTQEQFTQDQLQAVSDFKNSISKTFLNKDGEEETVRSYEAVLNRLVEARTKAYERLNNPGAYYDHSRTREELAADNYAFEKAQDELSVFNEQYKSQLDTLNKNVEDAGEHYQDVRKKYVMESEDSLRQRIEDNNKAIEEYNKQIEQSATPAESVLSEADQKAIDAKAQYLKTMDDLEKKQENERHLAEEIGDAYDEQAAKIEKLNTMVGAYLQARKDAGSAISDNNSWTIQTINEIEKLKGEVEDYADLVKQQLAGLEDEINGIVTDTNTTVDAQIELLEKLKESWADIPDAVKLVDEAIKKLKETTEGSKTEFQEWYDAHGESFEKSQEIVSRMNDVMDEYTSGQIQRYENEKDAALASLEEQYDKGLISEEEYTDKKKKIEKEAAENEYKLKMAQWASNIATTTGQTAMAVVNALANGGPPFVAIPMAAAVGALGAAQLATLIGSKPVPPSYATGGVVGGFQGATTGGDNTYIHARNGEMMLNARQQRNLFDMANSSGASGGIKVNIRNYMGESAEVTPELTGDTLNLIIDRRVTEQLSSGSYSEALARSEMRRQGTVITN